MTVPEQAAEQEQRYCLLVEPPAPIDPEIDECERFSLPQHAYGGDHTDPCVPAVLVPVSQREAEQAVIEAAWGVIDGCPNNIDDNSTCARHRDGCDFWLRGHLHVVLRRMAALAVQGDTDTTTGGS